MELKPYQQEVITDLARFLDCMQATKNLPDAFHEFWAAHPRMPLQPFPGTAIEPYKNTVPGVPHVTVKVPTAGGKTFLAANALRTIFAAFPVGRPKAVVWLVPSITILDQTLRNLKDPGHPYRQKINTHFAGRVEVYDKAALLQGSGFSASSVQEQLSLVVLSFDSLRAKNKEDRKVYQENGNLQSFGTLLGDEEDITLMRVIQALNPVVVVDESHNAESDLSVDMLKNLHPAFILDLTATPRKNSNIISFVDALALKKEHMVKLPVIVYNHNTRTEVINSALQLQRNLELQAKKEQKEGGRYIRPIVLFQAQPKTADDNTTFEALKQKLLDLKIPASHIRIKTASLNELKNEDLASPKCEVRYIITVNALKEGWDAPFAYILASLADKSSAVDVEQILGRVLRQPYVAPHAAPMLNMSYVLTASSKFLETLAKIVLGLNKAGFSARDYKVADAAAPAAPDPLASFVQTPLNFDAPAPTTAADDLADIDVRSIALFAPVTDEAAAAGLVADPLASLPAAAGSVQAIAEAALAQQAEFEKTVAASTAGGATPLPTVLQSLVKTYPIDELKPNEYECLLKRTEELKREYKATTGFLISKILQRKLWNQDEIPSALTGYAVPRFDKFAQMVLYFYNHLDHVFTVRLMKLLFYADFLHFSRTGCSISGNKYKAITYGPVPQEYQMQLGMLIDEGYLSQDLDHTKRRSDTNEPVVVYAPLKKANQELLTDAEWETLDAVTNYLGRLKTNDLVDLSHEEAAWKENEADRNLIDYQKYAFHLRAAIKIPHY